MGRSLPPGGTVAADVRATTGGVSRLRTCDVPQAWGLRDVEVEVLRVS